MEIEKIIKALNIIDNRINARELDLLSAKQYEQIVGYLLDQNIEIVYDIESPFETTLVEEEKQLNHPKNKNPDDSFFAVEEVQELEELNYKELSSMDQHMIDVTNIKYKSLSISEQMELARRYKEENDQEARRQLIEANMLLVISIAKRYYRSNQPYADLVQDGYLGLLRAVEKYDYTLGYAFSTYATYWICQSIGRELNTTTDIVRVPVNLKYKLVNFRKKINDLAIELGTTPTVQQIADYLNITPQKVIANFANLQIQSTVSLDTPIGDSEDLTIGDAIPDDVVTDPQEELDISTLRKELEEIIATLKPRYQIVLKMRFGFIDGIEHSLEESGNAINVTRERARQIEAQALGKLRHPSLSKRLRDYYY